MKSCRKPAAGPLRFVAYKLTRKAEEDVIRLYLTGLDEFGEVVAENFQHGLRRVFDFLADYPAAARERDEVSPPVRAHPYNSHVVIYIIDGSDVVILGVRHGREDWMAADHGA